MAAIAVDGNRGFCNFQIFFSKFSRTYRAENLENDSEAAESHDSIYSDRRHPSALFCR